MSAKTEDYRVVQAKSMAESFIEEKADGNQEALDAINEASENFELRKISLGKVLISAKSLLGGTKFSFHEVLSHGSSDFGERAQIGAAGAVGLIVALTVAAIVAAFLLPIGVAEIAGADLGEGASDGADALWGILDVMIVLSVFLLFTGIALAAM